MVTVAPTRPAFLPRAELDRLLDLLRDVGRTVIGPMVRDGAIVYDELHSVADLPAGWTDEQAPGRYRLTHTESPRLFDFTVGPQGWKRYTQPPRVPLGTATRDGQKVGFEHAMPEPRRLAFLGVRACEIAALLVQDRALAGGPFVDDDYRARRANALVVAVQCTRAGATCFCASMGTGPEVTEGYDLVLTEIDDGFLVDGGSQEGARLLEQLGADPATPEHEASAANGVASARDAMADQGVAADGLPARLMDRLDHPRWIEVADRCLACANCTMVCPTCFCTSVGAISDLDGAVTQTERRWDSCFNGDFARVAGGNFRPRRQDRYRQWLTHKFATWHDQFGTSGCVGCGRCITWCPVGIDVREELAAIAPPYEPQPMPQPVAIEGLVPLPLVSFPPSVVGAPAKRAEIATATVVAVSAETVDTSTLRIEPHDDALLAAQPGQFVMVEQPGFSPLPISISRVADGVLWLTIRAAGRATEAVTALRPGSQLGLRGPLGRGWPLERALGRDVVIVAGGIGLAPLRPVIDAVLRQRDRFRELFLAYGARTPADRLYVHELDALRQAGVEVGEIVDRAGPEWLGQVGVVTQLLDRRDWHGRSAVAFVCGPERMMQATVSALRTAGITRRRIFVSLERHMDCGVGTCGHCQMGPFFICRDGPVFSVSELGDLFGREGI
ncbi:MAG TPA: 4Fe-4S dicluster domain-containing protein [Candidatus Limnocylindria bacterium]